MPQSTPPRALLPLSCACLRAIRLHAAMRGCTHGGSAARGVLPLARSRRARTASAARRAPRPALLAASLRSPAAARRPAAAAATTRRAHAAQLRRRRTPPAAATVVHFSVAASAAGACSRRRLSRLRLARATTYARSSAHAGAHTWRSAARRHRPATCAALRQHACFLHVTLRALRLGHAARRARRRCGCTLLLLPAVPLLLLHGCFSDAACQHAPRQPQPRCAVCVPPPSACARRRRQLRPGG
jgi:hypothetical protein